MMGNEKMLLIVGYNIKQCYFPFQKTQVHCVEGVYFVMKLKKIEAEFKGISLGKKKHFFKGENKNNQTTNQNFEK